MAGRWFSPGTLWSQSWKECSLGGILCVFFSPFFRDHISGVMVSVLTSSAVDCRFEPRSGQNKDYKIGGISCFSTEAGSNKE